jgi:hypothetical protein
MSSIETLISKDYRIVAVGTSLASKFVMLIASIDVWSDPRDDRACRVDVYEDACQIVLEENGQRVLIADCPSVAAAMDTAAVYRRECSGADAHAA